MPWAEKLDELGKPAWIAIMILGFIIWWPLGLAILAYILWSGRMGCWRGAYAHGREGASRMGKPGTWWYRVRGLSFQLPTNAQFMGWSDPARIVVAKPTFVVAKPKKKR